MSDSLCSKRTILRWPVFAATVASVGSGCSAFAGWAGAKILDASGYADYNAGTSRAAGAIGGAVLSGVAALAAYPWVRGGIDIGEHYKCKIAIGITAAVADLVLSSAVGQGIQCAADNSTLDFGKQIAASAVGTAVTVVTIAGGAACLLGALHCREKSEASRADPISSVVRRRKKRDKPGASATAPARRADQRAGAFFPTGEQKRAPSVLSGAAVV